MVDVISTDGALVALAATEDIAGDTIGDMLDIDYRRVVGARGLFRGGSVLG